MRRRKSYGHFRERSPTEAFHSPGNGYSVKHASDARLRLERLADWFAVAIAVVLPWSTSASAILIVLWLAVLVPTLDVALVRRAVMSAAGGLPILLWLLALIGTLWSDASWPESVAGMGGYHKLLAIPLLLLQFQRSERGASVLYGFLLSSTVLVIASSLTMFPLLQVPGKPPGVAARDYLAQNTAFLICGCGLAGFFLSYRGAASRRTVAVSVMLAVSFFANIFFVALARAALLTLALLMLIFGAQRRGLRGACLALLAVCVAGAALWIASPVLRDRVGGAVDEVHEYLAENVASSAGTRLEMWRRSLIIWREAPLTGHGPGTIMGQFQRTASGTGATALVTSNPHNQILAVAISLGLIGAGLLLAMWTCHVMLFRGGDLIAWLGTVVVVQNISLSLFNSHLFDFFHGWLYVFSFGVLGGMALRQLAQERNRGLTTIGVAQ